MSKPRFCLCVATQVSACFLTSVSCAAESLPLLSEVATRAERPKEVPPLSAVCFSSRWQHPQNPKDPWDTFQTAAAFQPTDFVWVYSLDKQFVERMKQTGGRVFLAVNSLVPDEPSKNQRAKGRILDLDGNRVSAPWMRSWKESFWGCANSPDYRQSYVAYANRAVDAGTDGLQMDDPRMNLAAVDWGGCFCSHCLAGFREYLKTHAKPDQLSQWGITALDRFDYRDYLRSHEAPVGDAFAKYDGGPLKRLFGAFQEASVRDFYRDARAQIDAHAGRHVVFSSNNYAGRWQFPYDLFEFGMAELPERDANPSTIYSRLADVRRYGKAQLFTLVPKAIDGSEVALTRRVIATSYASGGHLIVPWDVYTGSDRPRYFGKPEQYADLYQFVREHARWIDSYEDAALVLPGMNDERYVTDQPLELPDAGDVAAFARAVPGQTEAPIVIHLVDWRAKPQPTPLRLLRQRFLRHGSLRAELLQPRKPPETLQIRVDGKHALINVPQLDPWGLVVVTLLAVK